MKTYIKRFMIFLIIFLSILLIAIKVYSYTTFYTEAIGSVNISVALPYATMEDEFSGWTKHITISNNIDSNTCFVRVKVFAPTQIAIVHDDNIDNDYNDHNARKWTQEADNYYYYSDPLNAGEMTDALDIRIENIPEDLEDDYNFSVIVVSELVRASYREDGSMYADWTCQLDSTIVEY